MDESDEQLPAAPSPRRERSLRRTLGWLLASLGVIIGFFALSGAGAFFVASVGARYHVYDELNALVEQGDDAALADPGLPERLEGELREQLKTDDMAMAMSIGGQVAVLIVFLPLWLRVRKRGFGRQRMKAGRSAAWWVKVALGIVAAGIGLQLFLSHALGFALSFMPEAAAEYDALMESVGTGEAVLANVLSVALLAPIVEEMTCRGLLFEFLLRAAAPCWSKEAGARGIALAPKTVLFALVCQAGVFALMHANVVQSSYALLAGVLFGWLYWRTGSLWCSIGLHLVVNGSSFAIEPMAGLLAPLGSVGAVVVAAAFALTGLHGLVRATGE